MVLEGRLRVVPAHDHVRFVPRRVWRRPADVVVPFQDIAGLMTVEPHRREPGSLTLTLKDGGQISTTFGKGATLRMRAVHRHIWRHVRESRERARLQDAEQAEHSS
jgi:hypothetical protein